MIVILLPAYNEEHDLGPLLEKIRTTMEEHRLPYRVLVVNGEVQLGIGQERLPLSAVTEVGMATAP